MARITILAGHYGSGKTQIAVNLALRSAAEGRRTALLDLDIVNPYFRTKDSEALLRERGIALISSPYAGSNLDVPSLSAEGVRLFDDQELCGVIDVGGDDRGALALGRYAAEIVREDCAVLLVVNRCRPLTRTSEDALGILREIEAAARVRFTGIVNNSHLGPDTTADTVLGSLPYAEEIARQTGLPVVFTAVRRELVPALSDSIPALFPMDLFVSAAVKYGIK